VVIGWIRIRLRRFPRLWPNATWAVEGSAGPEGISLSELKNLLEVLRPRELAARQALANAVAEELDRR
jgi:hypothetical protein